ncbi:MAG TPA: fused MFS/spermidine synthase [Thermoanaerobaculia bacterium]|nr:fused MFS/spermidine synthase [Thermoanaerobaculia bacterium]
MRRFLAVCFFLTGASGLVYEVLWSRHLTLLFGSTTEAVSVVLATFMTGLGLGAHVLGRRIDRSPSPLRIYATLEIGVGAYALLTGPLLAFVRFAYGAIASRTELASGMSTLLKAVLSAAVLLVPSLLMGGTLPALVRAVSDSPKAARRLLPLLYALNTLGAVAGTLAAGLLFLEVFGLTRTMLLCAAVNVGVGALVLARARKAPAAARASEEREGALGPLRVLSRSRAGRYALFGLFVSGATTMIYEVVETRVLALVFGVSSYAFTIVLAVFLGGLGLGALACALLSLLRAPRLLDFALAQAGVALAAVVGVALMPLVPRVLAYVRQVPELGFWSMLLIKGLLAALFLFPLAFFSGLGVPILIDAIADDLGRLGRTIGGAYLVNTFGTVAGSLAAGFLLIPAVGTEGSMRGTILVNLAAAGIGGLILVPSPRLRLATAAGIAAIALTSLLPARWPRALFLNSDTAAPPVLTTKVEIEALLSGSPKEVLFFREGKNATVGVTQSVFARTLLVGAHPDASDRADMATQALLGFVPLAAHPHPEEVFVVGFGSGVTADAAARFPDVKRVDVAELESAVVEASPFYHHVNHAVEKNPKTRILIDDARSILGATPRRYDVVLSEPSNPWRAGVASLFTADFYRSAKRVLKEGGVFGQWTQLYGLPTSSLKMILRTYISVFPEVQVWWLDSGDIVILGSEKPLPLSRARIDALLNGEFREDRRRFANIGTAAEFYSRFLLGTDGVKRFVADETELHTDDRPLLEFEAPRGLFLAKEQNALRLLFLKVKSGLLVPPLLDDPPSQDEAWLGVAALYRAVGAPNEAGQATRRAYALRATPLATVRMGRIELEANRPAEAANLLARADEAQDALPGDVATEREVLRARLFMRQGRFQEAEAVLEARDRLDGPEGVELLKALSERGLAEPALALAARLLPKARLGGPLGAPEVASLYDVLRSLGLRHDPAPALRLLETSPHPSLGFPTNQKNVVLAVLYEKAGRPADAVVACERARAAGLVDLNLLGIQVRALHALGRLVEERRVRDRVRELAPLLVTEPVPSPFDARGGA